MGIFTKRSNRSEILDNPDLKGEELIRNLDEIATINRWLGGDRVIISALKKWTRNKSSIEILDLGCGSGDLPRRMVDFARSRNISIRVVAVDVHPHVLDYARSLSDAYPEIEFRLKDAMLPFPPDSYDWVTMSLFLHHFSDDQIRHLISNSMNASRSGIIINDLHRNAAAYLLFKLFTFIAGSSEITRHDGAVSILRAFRSSDWKKYCMGNCRLKWKWAFRWQVIIKKGK